MNAGLMDVPSRPSVASRTHLADSCSAVSSKANAGTCLSFAAPYKPVFDRMRMPEASDKRLNS